MSLSLSTDHQDRTSPIATGYDYKDQAIIHRHRLQRGVKSVTISRATERAAEETPVFSDANAFYRKYALRNPVRTFHDASVGYVSRTKAV